MIWGTLALFAVSFILTALLAPKPQIENARADDLDPEQLPRVTEDDPIPLVLGRVRLNGPNTLWYGDYEAVAITQKVKTGLFSSKKQIIGYDYFLSVDLGICLGPYVQLRGVYVDDIAVFEASHIQSVDVVTFSGTIDEPELFGGKGEGGGFVGEFTYYPGNFDQPVSTLVEASVGAGLVPAYRGMSHFVFQANIGESANLRKIYFDVCAYTRNIVTTSDAKVNTDDMNPAEALVEVMTNKWRGQKLDIAKINMTTFSAARTTLHDEGNGVSLIVSSAKTGKDVVSEILRQIDGIMYEDPETGQFNLKLVRDDYDSDGVPKYDEDDILGIRNFTRTTWEEVYSQVKVSYSSRTGESGKVAIAQDMAVANMMGRMRTQPISFPFCYDDTLANALAARELSRLSSPLFRMTVELNRRAYGIRPGDVIAITWPEFGLNRAIVRVQKYDLGELLNNRIVIEVVQDLFAASDVVFANNVPSAWEEAVPAPVDVTTYVATEIPYFLNGKMPVAAAAGYVNGLVLPRAPQSGSSAYNLAVSDVSGTYDLLDPEGALYPTSFLFLASYSKDAGFELGYDTDGFTGYAFDVRDPVGTSLTNLRNGEEGLLYANGEWMGFTVATDDTGGEWTLSEVRRGLFGTTIVDHSADSLGYVVSVEQLGDGFLSTDLESSDTLYFKILDRIGPTTLRESDATERSLALQGIKDLPLRPRYLQLDGVRTGVEVAEAAYDLSWRPSNRNATTVTFEDDAAQTPDSVETYRVEVWIDGVEEVSLRVTGGISPETIDFTGITGSGGEFRVYADRTSDSARSLYYARLPFTLVGDRILTSGDMQSGTDKILLSGDMQDDTNDSEKTSGV